MLDDSLYLPVPLIIQRPSEPDADFHKRADLTGIGWECVQCGAQRSMRVLKCPHCGAYANRQIHLSPVTEFAAQLPAATPHIQLEDPIPIVPDSPAPDEPPEFVPPAHPEQWEPLSVELPSLAVPPSLLLPETPPDGIQQQPTSQQVPGPASTEPSTTPARRDAGGAGSTKRPRAR